MTPSISQTESKLDFILPMNWKKLSIFTALLRVPRGQTIGYNQLFRKVKDIMSKRTFDKYLTEMIEDDIVLHETDETSKRNVKPVKLQLKPEIREVFSRVDQDFFDYLRRSILNIRKPESVMNVVVGFCILMTLYLINGFLEFKDPKHRSLFFDSYCGMMEIMAGILLQKIDETPETKQTFNDAYEEKIIPKYEGLMKLYDDLDELTEKIDHELDNILGK